MLDRSLFPLTLLAAIGCGLIAGTFFGFSTFVMRALAALPPAHGIAAMQSINLIIMRTLFIPVFMLTAGLCLLTGVLSIVKWNQPGAIYLLAGSILYFAGNFLVTAMFNVPLNDALAAVKPESHEGAEMWTRYLSEWALWNHVRTVTGLAALVAFIMALTELNRSS